MKELTETFEKGNDINVNDYEIGTGALKSLVSKTSNINDLYKRNFATEINQGSFRKNENISFPASSFGARDDL